MTKKPGLTLTGSKSPKHELPLLREVTRAGWVRIVDNLRTED